MPRRDAAMGQRPTRYDPTVDLDAVSDGPRRSGSNGVHIIRRICEREWAGATQIQFVACDDAGRALSDGAAGI